LNVTERCNLRCLHCYWDCYGRNADPSLGTIGAILGQFQQLADSYYERGRPMLTLGGGEPCLRADLEDIVRMAVRRGFRVRMVTNAVLLDPARAAALRKAGLEVVQVSLDGATEATHDGVRGRGNWRRTVAGISALKQARLFTILSCVLLPGINLEESPALLDRVRQWKVAGAKFARPVQRGQASVHGLELQADYLETFRRILAHAEQTGYRRLLMFFDPLAHLLPLQAGRARTSAWHIATDLCQCNNTELVEVDGGSGDVHYCRLGVKLGNLWDQPLVDLWHHHPVLASLRRKTPAGSCRSCSAWAGCRGGCPAVVESRTGQVLLQDEACERVREQGVPVAFEALGHANARSLSNREKVEAAGRRIVEGLYRAALR
jgi:radical SAM protein with 4Fe4S-binding SPASM domain